MAATLSNWTAFACLAVAAAGCVYALCAAVVVRRFTGDSVPPLAAFPGVTILKPLQGRAAGLYDDLASFCEQDYGGPVQMLFGVQDPADASIGVVERLIAQRPGRDLELVVTASACGPNPKVANLAGLEPRIRHGVVLLADADIRVAPDFLRKTIAALDQPGVGAVTCLYRGASRAGVWAQLASMGIDYHFLPSVLVGLKAGLARPCFGSTIALRRETLAAIGGIRAFAHCLADDNAIGEAVRATHMKVAIPSLIVVHSCSEQNAAELWRHEVRWARTVRAVNALGYAGSVVTHPLPFAILGAALGGFGVTGLTMIVAALASRLVLQLQVDHTLGARWDRWWLGAARDLLAFCVHVASFFGNVVIWRGRRYRVRRDGTLTAVGEIDP